GGVALDEREPGQVAIAFALRVEVDALQVEILVLQRVGEFVREGPSLERPEAASLRDDVELLVLRAVQPLDLAAQQLDVEGAERGVLGEEAQALEEPFVGRNDRRRVVLLEG